MKSPQYIHYPRVTEVVALPHYQLRVCFDNGDLRLYDFHPKLSLPAFQLLKNEAFFRSVQVDSGGFGIVWSDDIDIAESELWLNGTPLSAERLAHH